jgi:hypothetical protein
MADLLFILLAICDFLTGAVLAPPFPALMWALYGLILGGILAFWLEAPIYGLRRSRPFLIGGPLLLLLLTASILYSQRTPLSLEAPAAPPPPPIPAPNFAGTWNTERWGAISFTQDGSHVFGTYPYNNGVIEGTTSPGGGGTSILRYRWRNQQGNANGVGYFTLAADALSFSGKWTEGENLTESGGQDWSGVRTGNAPPPPSFTGQWDTKWGEMQLNQGVIQVTGTYRYGGGLIDGEMKNGDLHFRWVNRVTGESGLGTLKLAPYGQSFTGTWGKGSNATGGGEWNGQRK